MFYYCHREKIIEKMISSQQGPLDNNTQLISHSQL